MDSDERIREAITAALEEKGLSQAALARKLKVKPQSLSPVVLRQKGKIPQSLIDVLDALDLELYVKPKG